jgi:VWFA-related protein
MRTATAIGLSVALLSGWFGLHDRGVGASSHLPLSIRITSPLGRTGLSGPIRIVAQVQQPEKSHLQPVWFYVDDKFFGEAESGPPYAVEWVDENPFERREIVAEACDESGECVRDQVSLKPLEILEQAQVSGVLLEASVQDATGRYVGGLTIDDFSLAENDVPQKLDLVDSTAVDTTYTLLLDCSQSMWRRMDFVQEAASRLLRYLRPKDRVIVVPFTKTIGSITGPTDDRRTVISAIAATHAGGGTALLDALTDLPRLLEGSTGRQAVVLVTDGYDEDSTHTLDDAVRGVKAAQATLFVVGVAGGAGISIKGEHSLRHLAEQSGGRAFFPWREEELPQVHDLIATDIQHRYLLAYTPSNQEIDGAWRQITLRTKDDSQKIRTRPGYFAPAPPPVRATIEFTLAASDHQPLDVSADAFELYEDGVKQTLDTFQEAVAPISIVLAMDASGSMRPAAEAVKDAASSFVQALRPSDKLALTVFADQVAAVHDLTTKREWTLEGIDQYNAKGGTALNDAIYNSLVRLGSVDGRRAIVLLTDGRDENNPGTAPGSVHTFAQVLAQLHTVDATIYAIGLGPKVDRAVLEKLASASGGEAFFPETVDSLADEYHRVVERLRQRYVASYVSTNPKRDGGWRAVDITTTTPSLTIKSRGGYFAPEK